MRYWKTCYITCFIFVLIPLTLYGQEDVEQLQKLDKLMFSGRCFESKELHKKISDTTTIPSDLELYYKFQMAAIFKQDRQCRLLFRAVYTSPLCNFWGGNTCFLF